MRALLQDQTSTLTTCLLTGLSGAQCTLRCGVHGIRRALPVDQTGVVSLCQVSTPPDRNTSHWNGLTTTAVCAWRPVSAAHKALSPIAGDTAP